MKIRYMGNVTCNMIVGETMQHACERGVERFLKAHPSGESSIYDVWTEYPGCHPNSGDVGWLQKHTEDVVFAAVVYLGLTFRRMVFVNCHIAHSLWRANGTFIGCTFDDGIELHPDAEVIE